MEQNTKNKRFFDYCHESYDPLSDPANKLRSSDLLMQSFKIPLIKKGAKLLMGRIQKIMGIGNTIWGIKYFKGKISWELYFYNVHKKDLKVNIANLVKALDPFFKVTFQHELLENCPYFMFSINLDNEIFERKALDEIQIYISGRPNSMEGFSYSVSKNGIILGNHYDFFDPRTEHAEIRTTMLNSPFMTMKRPEQIHDILRPEFLDCHTVCLSRKPNANGIYFSRLRVNDLIHFLDLYDFPLWIKNYINTNRADLGHLLYDIAFDYWVKDEKIVFGKKSYYGFF